MTPTSNNSPTADAIGTWLKRLALAAVVALLAVSAWCVWRISMVVAQTESAIVAISADVKQMSSSGAQISAHLENLDTRLQSLEQKAAEAMNLDELGNMLDEIDTIRNSPQSASAASPDTEREIKHLLAHVRGSKHRFVYSDENKGGTRFYLQLYAKYKAYDNAIGSAEDFIDKVATKTIVGQPYQVVVSPDQTVALNDWLTEELKKYRSTATTTGEVSEN
jgi:uncharacterized coiled-coil protein SlyX